LEQAILETDPRRPSDVVDRSARRALRGDLDTIVLKALKKRPEERYATMGALADDIERHLRNQPVLARPDRLWYRLVRGVARHKLAVAAAASVLAAILLGTAVAVWQARVALTEKEHAEKVKDFLITLFRDASPYNAPGNAPSPRQWLNQVRTRIDRLDHRPALRAEMLNVSGQSLLMLQDTDAAEEVLKRALDESVRELGPDHPHSLRARVLMLHVYRFRGQSGDFRDELARLLPILRAGGSALAEDLVMALKNQAHLELDAGRYDAAERAAHEAVDIGARLLGSQHPEAVGSLLTRAYVYQFSRVSDEALPASEQAYRAIVAAYPDAPTHPRRIEGRMLYGRALGEAGQPARAVEQLEQAVGDASAVFGAASRMVGFFILPLAEAQVDTGEIAKAIENSRRAVAIIGGHTNPQSFRYASALHLRGVALLAARRVQEALPDLARASETLRHALPPGHEVSRWFEADHAIALARAGRHAEARQRAAALLPAGPPTDSSGGRALYVMGLTLRLAGDASGALRFQRLALQHATRGRMVEIRRMRTLTEIGLALLDLSRPDEAAAALEQALVISRHTQKRAAPDRADILLGLARAHVAGGRPAAARERRREADAVWRDLDPGNGGS
jgi:serine/threonine-protein kinase